MLKLIIEAMQCVLYQQKSQFTEKFQVALAQRMLLLLHGKSPSFTLSLVYLPSD